MDQLNKMAEVIETVESIRRMAQLARDRAREQPGMEYYANTLNEIDRKAKMVAQQLSKKEPDMVAQQPEEPVGEAQMVTQQTGIDLYAIENNPLPTHYLQQMREIADGVIPWDMNYVYGRFYAPERNRR